MESPHAKKARAQEIFSVLLKEIPDARCALDHRKPLELLVATILSAQCTDKRVNLVTKGLFQKYNTTQDYAKANPKAFEQEIHSTGFYKNKAKSIIACTKQLVEKHKGRVPKTMEELVQLPGIGRKTANVILGTAFGIPGVVVDTHVKRISQRLGLTRHTDPDNIEQDLMELLPKKDWTQFSHTMIWHGRQTCVALRPKCPECKVNHLCPSSTT